MRKNTFSHAGIILLLCALLVFSPSVITCAMCAVYSCIMMLTYRFRSVIMLGVYALIMLIFCYYDIGFGIISVLSFIVPGIFVARSIKNRQSLSVTIITGACPYLIFNFLGIYFMALGEGYTVKEALVDIPMEQTKHMLLETFSQAQFPDQMYDQVLDVINQFGGILELTIVARFMISALMFSLLVTLASRYILTKSGIKISTKGFTDLRADISATIATVLVFIGATTFDGEIGVILTNVFIVMCVIYAVLGVAAVLKLIKKTVKKTWIGLMLIVIGLFIINTVSAVIAGIINPANEIVTIVLMFMPMIVLAGIGAINSLIPRKAE